MLKILRDQWKSFQWNLMSYDERYEFFVEEDRVANLPENRAKEWDAFLDSRGEEPDSWTRRPIPHWYAVGRLGGLKPEEIPVHVAWQREQGWEVE